MDFLDPIQPPPAPEPGRPRRPWVGPPGDWLGAPSVGPGIVGRSESVVVVLQSIVAYPVGCDLQIEIRARRVPGQAEEDWMSTVEGVSGHDLYGNDGPALPAGLRVEVHFADGHMATNLFQYSGSASGNPWDASAERPMWLWPLPPAKPFDVVIEWLSVGIPLTRTEVDGARVAEAAALAQPLWPDATGAES